jgi:hypothetical protein
VLPVVSEMRGIRIEVECIIRSSLDSSSKGSCERWVVVLLVVADGSVVLRTELV